MICPQNINNVEYFLIETLKLSGLDWKSHINRIIIHIDWLMSNTEKLMLITENTCKIAITQNDQKLTFFDII